MTQVDGTYTHRDSCRICGSKKLHQFLSLGSTPLANRFISKEDLDKPEPYYPLKIHLCLDCGLVQLLDVVDPQLLFGDYPYLTGASEPLRLHMRELADTVIRRAKRTSGLAVDIGSNDGTLLKHFAEFGFSTVGVEPAKRIAEIAESKGIETIVRFFDERCADLIHSKHGLAEIVTATNVFAHIDDLKAVLTGVNQIMAGDGVFVIEVSSLLDMLRKNEFDSIYHEHLSYYGARSLKRLFDEFGVVMTDIDRIPVHGGSLRVYVKKSPAKPSIELARFLDAEWKSGLYQLDTYHSFAKEVRAIRSSLSELLRSLQKKGLRITGYGATAKGNTLLNYCKIGPDTLEYISDTTSFKQGKYSPGMHIPILPEEEFNRTPPDYALLLAWNYGAAIWKKNREYRLKGGKFITPIPRPKIVTEFSELAAISEPTARDTPEDSDERSDMLRADRNTEDENCRV